MESKIVHSFLMALLFAAAIFSLNTHASCFSDLDESLKRAQFEQVILKNQPLFRFSEISNEELLQTGQVWVERQLAERENIIGLGYNATYGNVRVQTIQELIEISRHEDFIILRQPINNLAQVIEGYRYNFQTRGTYPRKGWDYVEYIFWGHDLLSEILVRARNGSLF